MLTPERMHQINVLVFETEVDAVAEAIVRMGLLHMVQMDEQEAWAGELKGYEAGKLRAGIDRLAVRISALMKDLGIRALPVSPSDEKLREVTTGDLTGMDDEISSLESSVKEAKGRRKELTERLERLRGIFNEVSPLASLGFPAQKTPYSFLEIHYGRVRSSNLTMIKQRTDQLAAVVLTLAHQGEDDVVLVIGLKADRLKLKRILREATFEEIEISDEARKESAGVTGELESKIADIQDQVEEIDGELAELREKNSELLTGYHRSLQVAQLYLKVKGYLKRTRKTCVFSGWLPSDRKELVEREILRAADGKAIIETVPPEEITGVKSGRVKVPVLLKHPGFFKPFGMLVASYGLPEYSFIDPTFFVAISFLIMFGMMFGDIGHGVVLAVIGWLLGFKSGRRNEAVGLIGKLVFYCGLSSIVFGVLFGSVFGLEDLIPQVWLKPMHDVLYFFKIAVYFGIAMISLGIVFNVINAIRARDVKAVLFDHAGVLSAIIYWGGIGAVSIFLSNRPVPLMLIIFAVCVPLIILFLREPIAAIIGHRRMVFEKGVMSYLMETVIEAIEILTGYLANTVSFIRVAAFSLAHVGLFIAVFSLVDMVKGKSGGAIYSALILILGNAVIIALEGLVVTIQAIRLEYYEFFGKFFMGGGKAYDPIGLEGVPDRNE